METLAIILMLLSAMAFFSAFALLFGVVLLYAVMNYLEKKE